MPVKIFFCYAHEDEPLLNKLKSHLRPLQRQGLIEVWYDRDISAGTEWKREISEHLNTADIILLLISADFIDSDYCISIEMKQAMERRERKEAHVIPIILRHVLWQIDPIGELQALPTNSKPVIDRYWYSLDEALIDIAKGIRKVVNELLQSSNNPPLSAFEVRGREERDEQAPSELESIQTSKRNVIAFSLGQAGFGPLSKLLKRLMYVSGSGVLLAYGGIGNMDQNKQNSLSSGVPHAKNITPTSEDVHRAMAYQGNDVRAFQSLSRLVVDKIAETYAHEISISGLILLYVDAHIITNIVPTIDILKERLPMCKIVLVTSLPEPYQKDERLKVAYETFIDLHKREKVEVTFLSDPRSPLALSKGLSVQEEFIALALASMAGGNYHYAKNPSFPELAEWLGRLSSFIGFSCGTCPIASGTVPLQYQVLRKIVRSLPPRGQGNVDDVIMQSRVMIDHVLINDKALTTRVSVDASDPFIMIFDIPVLSSDERFRYCAENILTHLVSKFPNGSGIVVQGNGIADFQSDAVYYSSCICLYPLAKADLLGGRNA